MFKFKLIKIIFLAGIFLFTVMGIIVVLFTGKRPDIADVPGLYTLKEDGIYNELELFKDKTMRHLVIMPDGKRLEAKGKWEYGSGVLTENIELSKFINFVACLPDQDKDPSLHTSKYLEDSIGGVYPNIEENFGNIIILLPCPGVGEIFRKQGTWLADKVISEKD